MNVQAVAREDFSNHYNYSYGANKSGEVWWDWYELTETKQDRKIMSNEWERYRPDGLIGWYYYPTNITDPSQNPDFTYAIVLPPDYENGEITRFVRNNVDYNYLPDNWVIPIVYDNSVNRFGDFNETSAQTFANEVTFSRLTKIILQYVFNIPSKRYGLSAEGTVLTEDLIYLDVPTDPTIYESFCHFRTNQTINLNYPVDVEHYTIYDYDYVFQKRIFYIEFNDSFAPGKDWFVRDYSYTDQPVTDTNPLVINTMGWWADIQPQRINGRDYLLDIMGWVPYLPYSKVYIGAIATKDIKNRYTTKSDVNGFPGYDNCAAISLPPNYFNKEYPLGYI